MVKCYESDITDLYELFKELDIIAVMKRVRLRWAGHVIRMCDNEMPKRIMNYNLQGKRSVQWPKARRIDAAEKDMRKAGVRNWRTEAKDRDVLQRILEVAKAHVGLQCH
jgi:hypothetical protein